MTKLVTEDDLTRARIDPAFRQQFLAENLDRLLEALKKIRDADEQNADTARQLREGADLAVQLRTSCKAVTWGPVPPDCSGSNRTRLVLPCLFAKISYKPRAPSILVGS